MWQPQIKRVDKFHIKITRWLRELGYSVVSLSQVGRGCPDLYVTDKYGGFLLEIKSPSGVISLEQQEFVLRWQGLLFITRATNKKTLESDIERQGNKVYAMTWDYPYWQNRVAS